MSREQQPGAMHVVACVAVSLVIGSLYVAACACSAFVGAIPGILGPLHRSATGLEALEFGWMSPWPIPWSANIFLVVGWILLLCNKNNLALAFGITAALAGLTTWAYFQTLLVGYYLWQASLFVLPLAALLFNFIWPERPAEAGSEQWTQDIDQPQRTGSTLRPSQSLNPPLIRARPWQML